MAPSWARRSVQADCVAVVTTSFPRDKNDPSGHFVASESERLLANYRSVHIVAAGGSGPLRERRGALCIHWLGLGQLFDWPGAQTRLREQPFRRLGYPLRLAWRLNKLLCQLRPGAVEAHWLVPNAWPLLARRHLVRGHAHGADVRLLLAMPMALRSRVLADLLQRCDELVFASQDGLISLCESTPSCAPELRARSRVRPPAIWVPKQPPASVLRQRYGYEKPTAILVGRLVPSKRPQLALEAAQIANLPLTIAGSGPLFAELAAVNEPERMLGQIPRDECLRRIAAADVLIHTSAAEAAPTVVREARRLGVPVVACPAGDVASWASVDPGIQVVSPQPETLAAALVKAIGR